MLLPKVVIAMARDRTLAPLDMQVWVIACEYLDLVEFRQLKAETIAGDASISPSTAWRSLTYLSESGYLERRRDQAANWEYRVPVSRIHPREIRAAA